jgi:hypothetical protein
MTVGVALSLFFESRDDLSSSDLTLLKELYCCSSSALSAYRSNVFLISS